MRTGEIKILTLIFSLFAELEFLFRAPKKRERHFTFSRPLKGLLKGPYDRDTGLLTSDLGALLKLSSIVRR